jgi:hypothetical protein
LTAWTELDPQGGFRYEIVSEGGSDYIRRKVLHKMLDGERDAIASGQPGRVALSLANYRFSVMSDDGQVAKLQIVPLRADTLLVNGTVTIEAGTGDLLSVEGRLAKNPSFWTNRVEVSRRYGRVAGVRVPLKVDSTASVKFAGTSEFSMTYEYASINGSAVGEPLTGVLCQAASSGAGRWRVRGEQALRNNVLRGQDSGGNRTPAWRDQPKARDSANWRVCS